MGNTKKLLTHLDFIILLIFVVIFLPFYTQASALDPALMPRFLILSVTMLVLSISFIFKIYQNPDIDTSVYRRKIFSIFLIYILISAIAAAKAVNTTEAVHEILKSFLYFSLLLLTTIIFSQNKNYIFIFSRTVTIIAAILSAIGLYQYLKSNSMQYYVTMANKNQLASALMLTLPFCAYNFFTSKKSFRDFSIITAILASLNIFFLQARAVWLAIVISTLISFLICVPLFFKLRNSNSEIKKSYNYFHIAILTLGLILVFCFLYSTTESSQRSIFQTDSLSERAQLWKQTLKIVKDNFMLGIGPGNWKIAITSYGLNDLPKRTLNSIAFQRPHNDYLWVLSEAGILAFVSYLAIFAIAIYYNIKTLQTAQNRDQRILALCLLAGLIAYMVVAFFSFPKERIFHSTMLTIMIAIAVTTHQKSIAKKKNLPRFITRISAFVTIPILCLTVLNAHIRLNAEIHAKKAFIARQNNKSSKVIEEIKKAYSPFATLDPTATPLKWYSGEAHFLLNNTDQACKDFNLAFSANPYHIHVLNNLATCCEFKNDHDNAIKYYQKAIKIYPAFEEALINLAAVYYNKTQYQQAYQTLNHCKFPTDNQRLIQYMEFTKQKLQEN